jgi:predicted phage baseplate assembly protein
MSAIDPQSGRSEPPLVQIPTVIDNPPGQSAIAYRVGTHTLIKQAMLARLAAADLPALQALRTRDDDDFAIALLDAWATVADVLTFYQERIANESYLRTATERVSLLHRAALIGYRPRPGVAASAFLAFTLEDAPGAPRRVTIDSGARVQSIPGPGETPQLFETIEKIEARVEWNNLRARLLENQPLEANTPVLLLQGANTSLRPGDRLLIVAAMSRAIRRVKAVAVDAIAQRTQVDLEADPGATQAATADPTATGVFALRTRAALFGHNAPDWRAMPAEVRGRFIPLHSTDPGDWPSFTPPPAEQLDLDAVYGSAVAGGWVAVERPGNIVTAQIRRVMDTAGVNYVMNAKISQLTLALAPGQSVAPASMVELRQTTVYLQSERLELAPRPVTTAIQGRTIDLDGLYEDLRPGQALAVSGPRADAIGEHTGEVAILAAVTVDAAARVTTLTLVDTLQAAYRTHAVTLNANVALSTHGDTVTEVLGSGDAGRPYQRFTLRQAPLTYVSAATAEGAESTLEVRVNGLRWHEAPTLFGYGPRARVYVTATGDDGATTIQFGDGHTGARPPAGQNNVQATYRKGTGLAGNVPRGQLSMLLTRPLGVKSVTNPQDAGGAQDPESVADIRRNATLPVLTLGRVVSLQDYSDFARAFAGIAKALATWTWNGRQRGVFVTVAGPQGAEIKPDSKTHRNLLAALQNAGDPNVRLQLASYHPIRFRLSAKIKVDPDARAEDVLATVTAALQARYGFEARDFGQPVALSEVMAAIQATAGVVAVDVDRLHREDMEAGWNADLPADLPRTGPGATLLAAELLTLYLEPADLEVMP